MKKQAAKQRPETLSAKEEGLVRLNKYLAQCGLGSRRKCDELIASGAVIVNGKAVSDMGVKVDPAQVTVEVGKKKVQRVETLKYFAFYKPKDTIVTAADPQGRTTVYDFLKKRGVDNTGLKYVGRLDRNSEGLLILTNDGDLVHALTHPRFQIKKVYRVRIDRRLLPEDATRMIKEGVRSEDVLLRAGDIREVIAAEPGRKKEFWYEIDLFEGKNRQIRRMLEGTDYRVMRLKRIQFGSVRLGGMLRGQIRPLTEREVSGLRNTGHKKRKCR